MKESIYLQKISDPVYATLDDWILHEAIPFSVDSSQSFNACVDRVMASLDDSVKLLGLGEALHGGEDILMLRNRLFQRLAEKHGFCAIAIESSFPRARAVNEYVAGRGPASYDALREAGFSHGFGRLEANQELVEWMRSYNADAAHCAKLRFYGFDSPSEMMYSDSPAQVLHFVLDYLASIDSASSEEHRLRIDQLLGPDCNWENPAAMMDPTKSIGLSPAATALRIEVEDLIAEMQVRRPELVAKSDKNRYLEAMQYATLARWLLNYHAALAQKSNNRLVQGLGLRDAMMADNLAYVFSRERGRGKVLAFAHNSHLQRGKAEWQLGSNALAWWPAGAHLDEFFGPSYAVIGTALGVSDANGIGRPQVGTLEARLTAMPGPARFIPTHKGQGLATSEIAALPVRSGSMKNSTYFALTPQSFTDFDWLAVLDSTAYSRGGPQL
ncbi:MAG: erythromycin esterase family protein [Methanothrix sp.]